MASFENKYTHRKVAENASKPCDICYKPSTSVLVTDDNKDFFYICPSHLKDKGFCSAITDEAAIAAKKKKEMEEEVERVKKEYEEKQKKKKDKKKEKEKEKGKDESKDKEKDKEKKDEDKAEKKPTDEEATSTATEEPRVFSLQKSFFQQRINKKRNIEIAKRNRERLQNPSLFPQVPKGFS